MNNTERDKRMEQFWLQMTALIKQHGHALQHVMGDADFSIPGIFYTVGLSAYEMPDLIVFGLPGFPGNSAPIVSRIVNMALKGDLELIDGQEIHKVANLPFRLRAVDPEKGFTFATGARRYAEENGHTAKLLQILLPDVKGRFPGDASCDPRITQMQDINYLRMKDQVRNMVLPI